MHIKANSQKKTVKSINDVLQNNAAVILVHSHKCGHCIRFQPEWNSFIASNVNEPFSTVEIEATHLNSFSDIQQQIIGFPTILVYKDGKCSNTQAGYMPVESLQMFIDKELKASPKKQIQKEKKIPENKIQKKPNKETKRRKIGGTSPEPPKDYEYHLNKFIQQYFGQKST